MEIRYCNNCGAAVELTIPQGENLPRHVCSACGRIHYLNPRIITGCLPLYEDRLLLCRRAIEPCAGKWTLPAGFMENHETAEAGALREMWEEAGARARIERLFSLYSAPLFGHVYLFFLARMQQPEFEAGEESLEVRLFRPEEIPWQELVFSSSRFTLREYLRDHTDLRVRTGMLKSGEDCDQTPKLTQRAETYEPPEP